MCSGRSRPAVTGALRDFRIGYVLDDPAAPVSAETRAVLESVIRACERAGATMKPGWPDGFRFQELLDTYYFHLGAVVLSLTPPHEQERARANLRKFPEPYARGALSSFVEWQQQNLKRLAFRALWERFFESVDVFLLPTTFTTATTHDRTPPARRQLADTGRRHLSLLESPDLHHAGNVDGLSRDNGASGSEPEWITGGTPDCRAVSGRCDADRLRASARAGDGRIPGTKGYTL